VAYDDYIATSSWLLRWHIYRGKIEGNAFLKDKETILKCKLIKLFLNFFSGENYFLNKCQKMENTTMSGRRTDNATA